MSAVTNYCKVGVLKEQNLFSHSFGVQKSEIKMLAGLRFLQRLWGGFCSLTLPASGGCWHHSNTYHHLHVVVSLCLCVSPLLFLIRTLATGFGATWILRMVLSQDL